MHIYRVKHEERNPVYELEKKMLSCIVLLVFLAVVFAIGYWKQEGIPVFGKTLDEAGEKKIALTFDDGPHPYYTEQLLDGLKNVV